MSTTLRNVLGLTMAAVIFTAGVRAQSSRRPTAPRADHHAYLCSPADVEFMAQSRKSEGQDAPP
jgi:hypothetical protein